MRAIRALIPLLALIAGTAPSYSLGDLVVAPTRLIFEGRIRSAEIALINHGTQTATYRVGFVDLEMGEDGRVTELSEAPETASSRLLRFSPRQVTLAAGETQTVRVQVRKPADLVAGEYRSHLVFRHLPDVVPEDDTEEKKLGVSLVAVYGVSIPVIVRHGIEGPGTLTVAATEIAQATADRPLRLVVTLLREGATSVYCDLEVEGTDARGAAVRVGLLRGVAVYVPNDRRVVEIPLEPDALAARDLRLRVKDRESDDAATLLEVQVGEPGR